MLNDYQHQRALMDAGESFVTTPNNDTLYSQAWVDLNNGPITLTLPTTGSRYFSIALMDMYTNNFAILGTRTTGEQGRCLYVDWASGGDERAGCYSFTHSMGLGAGPNAGR